MKKKDRKALKGKILAAIIKVLKTFNANQTNKSAKAVNKSIIRMVKKIDVKKNSLSPKNNETAGLNSDKNKTKAVTVVPPQKRKITT